MGVLDAVVVVVGCVAEKVLPRSNGGLDIVWWYGLGVTWVVGLGVVDGGEVVVGVGAVFVGGYGLLVAEV